MDRYAGGVDTDGVLDVALTAGTALVTAMVTDGWEGVRARVAHWFGRGVMGEEQTALAMLDESRKEMADCAGAELAQARARQEAIWQTRISDLVGRYRGAGDELPALIDQMQAHIIGSARMLQQTATAYDQAQQAVQGQGVQVNTFGGQGGSR